MKKINKSKNYSVVDLFCGVGGLTNGFIQENFNVVAGLDLDKTCKYAFEKNNNAKFIHQDISTLKSQEIQDLYTTPYKILVGCAPCQDFSDYNQKKHFKSGKWKLVHEFARVIQETDPDIISMENVPQLKKYGDGNVFQEFLDILEEKKYHISYSIIDAQNYGVPQRRNRLILFASKFSKIKMIPETHTLKKKTIADTIKHLPKIEAGEVCSNDPLHRSRSLSELNLKRIKATPEGGGWKDWDESLRLECHKKESGKTFGSVYGRMKWQDVAPTLTTFCIGLGNGRFGHPEQNRAISLREASLLQSFPENYDFINPNVKFSAGNIARQVGNSVPVLLARAVAQSIKQHILEINDE